jgi:hypothetical protein
MADPEDVGRPMPVLLVMLWGSFLLMIISGVAYGLGLPEDIARAFFIATVIIWLVLGIALLVQGQMETRSIARRMSSQVEEASGDDAE